MTSTELLQASVPPAVRRLCERLHELGHAAWVVGGCVRDRLLATLNPDAVPNIAGDWDVATSARPDAVTRAFPKVIPTGIEHGTVTVLLDRVGYEVTTFRAEANYRDGRRPGSVHFLDDIAADLARRDFTVNAIAYDPLSDTLADPYHGIDDLQARLLRAVGAPDERFAEDGLRVLRAARFVATLQFELEPATARAIRPSLASYAKVSSERIRDEWVKAMKAQAPSRAFEVMKEHGMLDITAPEFRHVSDWGHALRCLDACAPSLTLRVSALLHGMRVETADGVLKRLRFSNQERLRITDLIKHRQTSYQTTWTDADVRRWLRCVSPDLLDELSQLGLAWARTATALSEPELARISELYERARLQVAGGAPLSIRDLALGGKELIAELGIEPGPAVGSLLQQLLEAVIDAPELNTPEGLLTRARQVSS